MKEENGILNASVIVIVSLEVFNHSNSSRQRLTGPMDYAVKLYNRTNNGIWNEPSFIVQFTVVTRKEKKKKKKIPRCVQRYETSIVDSIDIVARQSHEFTDTVACSLSTNPFHDEIHCTWH